MRFSQIGYKYPCRLCGVVFSGNYACPTQVNPNVRLAYGSMVVTALISRSHCKDNQMVLCSILVLFDQALVQRSLLRCPTVRPSARSSTYLCITVVSKANSVNGSFLTVEENLYRYPQRQVAHRSKFDVSTMRTVPSAKLSFVKLCHGGDSSLRMSVMSFGYCEEHRRGRLEEAAYDRSRIGAVSLSISQLQRVSSDLQ